jgi:hypothetical protein
MHKLHDTEIPTTAMPRFCLADYDRLLEELLGAGYELCPVEKLTQLSAGRVVLLRHDIDLHIPGIERMAEIETSHGVSATYYVPLTLHFNPLYPENAEILRRLIASGHHIGLHYDLQTYPWDERAAWRHLDHEVAILSAVVGSSVESICMHAPWGGRDDIFRMHERYLHPHSPRYAAELIYISDSCRAWRDETLLRCFGDCPPGCVLLNTHPELWLGGGEVERYDFARGTMLENVVRQHRAYVSDYMIPAWTAHPAPRLHEGRERRRDAIAGHGAGP